MEQKKCKCGRILPEGYKHKYCEKCRNKQADNTKKGIIAILGGIGALIFTIITIGKFKSKK